MLLLLFCLTIKNYGQRMLYINQYKFETLPTLGLVGGVSGFHSTDLELGIGLNLYETRPRNKIMTKPFLGCSISANLNPDSPDLKGENFNIWFSTIFTLGLNQNYYIKGDLKTWGMKPFIGLEFYGISFIYGYNFFLTKNQIDELSNNVFSVRYFLPVIRLKNYRL